MRVTIPKVEEERLLKIVQKSLILHEKIYQTCMDSLPEKVASCSTPHEQRGVLRDFTRKDTVDEIQKKN